MKRKKFIQYLGMFSFLPVFAKNAFSSVSNFISDDEKCKLVWKELCGKSSGDKSILKTSSPVFFPSKVAAKDFSLSRRSAKQGTVSNFPFSHLAQPSIDDKERTKNR